MSDGPADRTTKLARGRGAESTQFVWPAPPYYDFTEEIEPEGEACLLAFTDGEKASGLLLSFVPEFEVLKFHPDNAKSAATIAFSALLSVQLLSPVSVRRQSIPASGAMFSPSDRQPFFVQLVNNSTLEGETVGHVHALCGVFLFLPQPDGKVTRCFVPTQSAQDTRIRKPLGEMLIEEQLASPERVTQALEKQKLLRTRKLGEYLTATQIVSQEQLAAALKHQSTQPVQKLGETLVDLGFLTRAELKEALPIEARDRSIPLGQILADMGVVDIDLVHSVMAKKLGIPFVDLRKFRPSPEALKKIPAALATRYQILPLAEAENALVVAVDNATNMERMDEVRFIA